MPMLSRMEAAWDPARMDALLLLHPLDTAIGREGDGPRRLFPRRRRPGAPSRRGRQRALSLRQRVDLRLLACSSDSPDGPFSLLKLWNRAEAAGRLFGLVHDGQWFHVGTPQALAEAERVLR